VKTCDVGDGDASHQVSRYRREIRQAVVRAPLLRIHTYIVLLFTALSTKQLVKVYVDSLPVIGIKFGSRRLSHQISPPAVAPPRPFPH
jgi:hypothetical protein